MQILINNTMGVIHHNHLLMHLGAIILHLVVFLELVLILLQVVIHHQVAIPHQVAILHQVVMHHQQDQTIQDFNNHQHTDKQVKIHLSLIEMVCLLSSLSFAI